MHRRIRLVLASLAAVAGLLAAPAAALAAEPAPQVASTVGHDVSHPQCDGAGTLILPTGQAFGIVGVNGGIATISNPCLDSELAWASASNGTTAQAPVAVYVNTANPGLEASWWPAANRTVLGTAVPGAPGTCRHAPGPACAYVYGYSLAEQDMRRPAIGLPLGTIWYLDVEEANTWSPSTTANRAVLEGMAAAFTDAGARTGLYANRSDWNRFIGTVPAASSLYRLPTWLAGAVTPRGAAENCTHAPLAGGRITLSQYLPVASEFDYDVSCAVLPTVPRPSVAGSAKAGARLSAVVARRSGVATSFQWRRNGSAVAGATSGHYVLGAADRGAAISVRVVRTRPGYSREIVTSAARRIAR
ncbi:MAG: hypothetical protein QOC59_894 [Microbacteriaceae bacterium]|nr:hypothetical protein [Microbacteriaceae bacterium]